MRIWPVFIALVGLLLFQGPCAAAEAKTTSTHVVKNVACKAPTRAEVDKIICADPALSELDDRMWQAYWRVYDRTDAARRPGFEDIHRAILNRRNSECPRPFGYMLKEDTQTCIIRETNGLIGTYDRMLPPEDRSVRGTVIALAVAAVLLTAIVYPAWNFGILALYAGFGLAGALFYLAAGTQQPRWSEFLILAVLGAVLAVCIGTLICGLFAVARRPGLFLGFIERFRDYLSRCLKPSRWPQARNKLSEEEIIQRGLITATAATGSVIGSLMAMEIFWEAIGHILTPTGVIALIIIMAISALAIHPWHEALRNFIVGGDHHRAGHIESTYSQFWRGRIGDAIFRLGTIMFVSALLEVLYVSVHDCIQKGADPIGRILLAGIIPGIVTFYWVSAMQYRVASLTAAIWPSILALVIMRIGFAHAEMIARLSTAWSIEKLIFGLVLQCFFAVVFGLAISAVHAGLPSLVGARVLAAFRWPRSIAYFFAALVMLSAVDSILGSIVPAMAGYEVTFWSAAVDNLAAALGWCVGLVPSGFLAMIKRYQDDRSELPLSEPAVQAAPDQTRSG